MNRRWVLGVVLTCVGLPVLLVVVEALTYHVRNRANGSIVSSGRKREYVLHVPRSYDSTRPTPLVISMHGAGLWGAAQREISQWDRVAEREGIIVVYPSGDRGGVRVWEATPSGDFIKDVTFISELIDTLRASYNIDTSRVYADGLSNGGGMAFVLSCRLSDRIAAVGLVASAQLLPFDWCMNQRPVPMIAIHGTADPVTPYQGGRRWVTPIVLPNIASFTARWARRNQCSVKPVDTSIAADVTRREYTGCAGDAGVVLYTVQGGGHTWPGGGPVPEWLAGPTSSTIDASTHMWAFFREHSLRGN